MSHLSAVLVSSEPAWVIGERAMTARGCSCCILLGWNDRSASEGGNCRLLDTTAP
jgi:hypothetical protein